MAYLCNYRPRKPNKCLLSTADRVENPYKPYYLRGMSDNEICEAVQTWQMTAVVIVDNFIARMERGSLLK